MFKSLSEVWEGEVGTLKHELWQTIQAHNHNADLLPLCRSAKELFFELFLKHVSTKEAPQRCFLEESLPEKY